MSIRLDVGSLKRYIYENGKVDFVLQEMGHRSIQYHPNKDYYSCENIDGDNIGAINVYNNQYLGCKNWTRPKDFDEISDIVTLVQYDRKCSFVEAVKFLHDALGLEYSPYKKPEKKQEKPDVLAVFKNAKAIARGSRSFVDVNDIQALNEETLNEYVPLLHIDWYREGIMPWCRDKFGLAYSYRRKRVVIPIRYWLDGTLLGFNQRTTIENHEELGIRKYLLTPSYQKSLNLYGLWEQREEIEKARYIVITESEKSVFKRYSRNDPTCVALQGKTLSQEQKRIILGLDIDEVVICLDQDVPMEEVRFMCEQFYRIRKVSYIRDSHNLIGKKDSPCDAPNKIYNFLFKWRTPYEKEERNKYLGSLKGV